MTNTTSARDLASQLFEAESAVSAALAKAALLTESMVYCQRDLKLSPVIGHRALDRMGALMVALTNANTELASVHRRLDEIRVKVGLDETVGYGGGEKPPMCVEEPEEALAT